MTGSRPAVNATSRADDLYARLAGLHDDLSQEEGAVVSARLILILADLVADEAVLYDAILQARDGR